MKAQKSSVYLRYEFSDESGKPEGGDVFKFDTLNEVQQMIKQAIAVAHSDDVTINITIGRETPFFGFLEEVGVSRKEIEDTLVDRKLAPIGKSKKAAKKKPAKKKLGKK